MSAATKPRTTYDDLIADPAPWDMVAIATNLNVQPQTVRKWRRESLADARAAAQRPRRDVAAAPHPNHLPMPDIPVAGKPLWKAGTIRKWAMQTGRLAPDGTPIRLKPPGRPRTRK